MDVIDTNLSLVGAKYICSDGGLRLIVKSIGKRRRGREKEPRPTDGEKFFFLFFNGILSEH